MRRAQVSKIADPPAERYLDYKQLLERKDVDLKCLTLKELRTGPVVAIMRRRHGVQ